MVRKKEFVNQKGRIVYAEHDDFVFLKKKGINLSSFFRQAVLLFKKGAFKYSHMEQKPINEQKIKKNEVLK